MGAGGVELTIIVSPAFALRVLHREKPPENNRLARLPDLSYAAVMKTLTIRLPDVLARRIEQESVARGVSKSDIVRERLNQPALAPLQDGSLRDILEEGWQAKVPAQPARFRSAHKHKLAQLIRAKKLHR